MICRFEICIFAFGELLDGAYGALSLPSFAHFPPEWLKPTPSIYKVSKEKSAILIGIQKKGFQLIQQTRKVSDLTAPVLFHLEQDRSDSAVVSKVLLNTEPADVRVFLNGQEVKGTTPLEVQLEVGKTYKLKFQKQGYVSKETTLTVDVPGALEKTVYLSAIKREVPVPAETKISPPAQLGSPGKKMVNPGTLSVTSNPWAYMYVDDKKVGETPVVGFSTTPGKHLLRLSNPDLNVKDKEVTVDIQENKQMKCSYEFDSDVLQCF